MRFYTVDTMAQESDDYCFVDDPPRGTLAIDYKMSRGEEMADDFPEDARLDMSEEDPGLQLCSLIGNTRCYLITNAALKAVIEGLMQAPTEYLPISIYNHKGRVASDSYFIINPLGVRDCLDLGASVITWVGEEVATVDEFVLDAKKVEIGPHLFRVAEDPTVYVVSETVAEAMKAVDTTNLVLTELKVAP